MGKGADGAGARMLAVQPKDRWIYPRWRSMRTQARPSLSQAQYGSLDSRQSGCEWYRLQFAKGSWRTSEREPMYKYFCRERMGRFSNKWRKTIQESKLFSVITAFWFHTPEQNRLMLVRQESWLQRDWLSKKTDQKLLCCARWWGCPPVAADQTAGSLLSHGPLNPKSRHAGAIHPLNDKQRPGGKMGG